MNTFVDFDEDVYYYSLNIVQTFVTQDYIRKSSVYLQVYILKICSTQGKSHI